MATLSAQKTSLDFAEPKPHEDVEVQITETGSNIGLYTTVEAMIEEWDTPHCRENPRNWSTR
jgi:hypothetical protein